MAINNPTVSVRTAGYLPFPLSCTKEPFHKLKKPKDLATRTGQAIHQLCRIVKKYLKTTHLEGFWNVPLFRRICYGDLQRKQFCLLGTAHRIGRGASPGR